MKTVVALVLLVLWLPLQAQDTTTRNMDTVNISSSLLRLKNIGLYDLNLQATDDEIGGFAALSLFDESMGSQIWFSKEPACLQAAKTDTLAQSGQYSLHVTWDKITGGCKWLGMGIGWDNWQPKDLSGILDSACIQIQFRSQSDTLKSLPLAMALEDYTGAQCFVGFSAAYLSGKIVPGAWTIANVPLSDFPFDRFQTNPSMIKQFIIQFEADGNLYIDNIRLVRKKK